MMGLLSFSCHDCRAHLAGYIHRELPPKTRQRVAAHLNGCSACYKLYAQQRDLARELSASLPLIGRAGDSRLDRIWSAVQDGMAQPASVPRRHSLHYSIVALALVLVLIAPWLLTAPRLSPTGARVALALPTQPTPQVQIAPAETPAVSAALTAAAGTPEDTADRVPPIQSNYAPPPGATDTP
jgi:anti-sigma factor RsiW